MAKSAKKKPAKRRQICATETCRKYRLPYGELCRTCARQAAATKPNGNGEPQTVGNLGEALIRVTELELANINRVDTEVKLLIAEQRILLDEQYRADVDYDNLKHQRAKKREMKEARQRKKERELTAHLQTIAARLGLDANQMSINEVTGIIRDLRSEVKQPDKAPAPEAVGPN